jgi:hypothetical protein
LQVDIGEPSVSCRNTCCCDFRSSRKSQARHALEPFFQMYGIAPDAIPFNDQKLATKTKQEAGDLLATLDKRHPDGN